MKLKTIVKLCAVLSAAAMSALAARGGDGAPVLPQTASLDGAWKLSFWQQPECPVRNPADVAKIKDKTVIPASVPGNVETDLFKSGIIDNPQIGDNPYKLRKYEGYQWMLSREFSAPKLSKGQRLILKFGGIDTLADIFVNGKLAGSAENMFIPHEFDITDMLSESGVNRLDVIIRSALIESQKFRPIFGGGRLGRAEFVFVRKAAANYGWDILPRLLSAGLWRPVSLETRDCVYISDVNYFARKVDVKNKTATFCADFKVNAPFEVLNGLTARVTLSRGGEIRKQESSRVYTYATYFAMEIKNADLWWPRGYGEPALYDARIDILASDGKILASDVRKVGMRTVKLEYEDIEIGKTEGKFRFVVNGVPIFVHGTNWVQLDALHGGDASHLKAVFDMAVDLNCNMLRCWGGSVYESEEFYNLCDANGILVWQDFAFACSVYPQNAEFAAEVGREVESVVTSLRWHPSIVLWAGNNENDQAYGWRLRELAISPNYDKLSREVIPDTIREFDWTRPYLPSSPYISPEAWAHPESFRQPEVHLWGSRPYFKGDYYAKSDGVFVSEIGYHGCPNRSSLERMMRAEFVYPWNDKGEWNREWQAKATMAFADAPECRTRNELLRAQMKHFFDAVPADLDDFIFASQVVQAEALKYFIEHWRGKMFAPKTGILWWNLRDGWPIVSDAVVDYYNSKKLAYYYIKRSQEDVLAMIDDSGGLAGVNGTLKNAVCEVSVTDADTGKIVFNARADLQANGRTSVGKIDVPDGQGMLLIKYRVDGGVERTNHYLYGKPKFKLEDYRRWFKKLGIDSSN